MKKVLNVIVMVFLLVLFTACGKEVIKNTNGKVVLSTNGGVPYKWEYKISDSSIIEYVETVDEVEEEGLSGGEVKQTFIFKGLKAGKTDLVFEYKSFVDQTIDKTVNYEVSVDKNLNVTIVEK